MQNWITPITLAGRHVTLIPLSPDHAPALLQTATPDTFRYFSRRPDPYDLAGFARFIEFLLGPAGTVPFCVTLRETGQPVGITTFLDIKPEHRGVEIGWTWIAPHCRGTRINPEMKLMMMTHAFEDRGAIRVCLKTDERNRQSRAAIEKLGARPEGILRHVVIMPDGFRRSTAVYSVLDHEWPAAKTRMEARVRD